MHDDAASLVAVRHFLPQASELHRVGQADEQKSTAWTGEACLVHWQVGFRVWRSGREREGPLYIRCVSGERGSARGSLDASVSDAWGRSGEGAKRGGTTRPGAPRRGVRSGAPEIQRPRPMLGERADEGRGPQRSVRGSVRRSRAARSDTRATRRVGSAMRSPTSPRVQGGVTRRVRVEKRGSAVLPS